MHEILVNKVTIIQRCVKRVYEEYDFDYKNLINLTKQDSIVMNIQRAYEAINDLSLHIIAERKLGIPNSRIDTFDLLQKDRLIDTELSASLQHIKKFLDTSLKKYVIEDINVLESILNDDIDSFLKFTHILLQKELT